MTSNSAQTQQSPSELMEQKLKSAVENTMSSSDEIKGLSCSSIDGYSLAHFGTMSQDSGAIISHLCKLVGELESEPPVIQLEGKNSKVLIHSRGDIIVGINKTLPEKPATRT